MRFYTGAKGRKNTLGAIIFKDIINYAKKNAKVSDFKGKLLIKDR